MVVRSRERIALLSITCIALLGACNRKPLGGNADADAGVAMTTTGAANSGSMGSTGSTGSARPHASSDDGHHHRSGYAEVKGSLRHRKGDGERVEELGANGELDPIHSLWGSGPKDIYAAGWDDPGHGLLHSNGDGTWTHESVPESRLRAVWGFGPTDVYAAGNDGVIYHGHTGGQWKREHAGSRGVTSALWGSGPKDVYAVGAYGEVLRSKGDGTWQKGSIGNDKTLLLAIWGSGPSDVYAAGNDGIVFHSKGDGAWTQEKVPGGGTVSSLWGSGPRDVYAVANTLFHSTGDGTWQPITIDGLNRGSAVHGDARGTLWVGGSNGTLFVRRNSVWSSTKDKGAGNYQALWATGDDLYIGGERFIEHDTAEPHTPSH